MLKIPTWGREKPAQAHDETLHPFPQGSTFSFAQEKGRLTSGSLFIWLLRTPATSGTTNRADFSHSWHTKPQFLGEKNKKAGAADFPTTVGDLEATFQMIPLTLTRFSSLSRADLQELNKSDGMPRPRDLRNTYKSQRLQRSLPNLASRRIQQGISGCTTALFWKSEQ